MAKSLFSFFSASQEPAPITDLSLEMLTFLNQYPLALLLVDATGRITFANPSAVRLLRTSVEVLNTSYVDRFGLTMEKLRSMAQSNPPAKVVLELVNDQADSVFVGACASFLASTPYLMLTLESIPHFTQLTADNAFLRAVVDGSPAAITVQNGAGQCVLWSKRAEQLFGYAQTDTLQHEIYAFLPKEMVPSLQHLDDKILQDQMSQPPVQLSYKNKNEQETVVRVSKVFLPATLGKDVRILTLFEDITQRYFYEKDLLQNRNLLRAVLDNVPLGLYTRDCDNRVTFYNRQSLEVLNEKNEENVSKAHAYQTKKDTDKHHSREQEILREGKIKDYPEEEYTDSQGNKKILHLRKVPLMDAGPKPLVLSIVEDITEKLKQEKEIRRANSLLSAIVQNAPIGLYARTPDGRMLLRNQQCADLFGTVSLQAMNQPNFTLPHETPQQVSGFLARERALLESGETLHIPEEPYVTGDGSTKLLRMVKVPVSNSKDAEKFVITLVEDITQRKAQEKDLLETKNFLQTLLDNVPVAIYARGVDDKIMFVNRRAHELFPGEDENSQQQGNAPDFYDKREQSIFQSGEVMDLPEERYTTLTGQNIILHLVKAPVFDKDGKPFMVLTVAEDITEKKAQEQAIIDAKNFLQAVINNLPVSLSVKSYDGRYILWNKKSEEIFGCTSADVIGQTSYRKDLNKEQQEFVRESDLKVFESKKEQNIPQELISTAQEGGVKIMHTVKTPVFHEDGTPNCLIVVSEDITAKTRMEKQIREASDKNTLLIENAREGILLAEDQKVMYANRSLCRILGYNDLQELTGKPLGELTGDDYKDVLKEKYDAVLAGTEGSTQPVELKWHKKDGREVEIEFAAVASRYLGRRIVLCFVRDITAWNREHRELVRERESYRLAFEKSATPSLVLLSNGRISLMNQAARELFDLQESDKTFYRNVYVRPALTLAVRRALGKGEEAQMDYRFDFARAARKFPGRFDESKAPLGLHLQFVPLNKRTAKDGTVWCDYVVTLQESKASAPQKTKPAEKREDHTLLRKPLPPATQAILPAKAAREMLVLPNSEPYVLCSADFKMRSCNALFCELCQLSETELLGQPISSLVDDESRAQFEADLHGLAETGVLSNRDYFINPASGLEKVSVRLTGIKEDGRYLFVLRNRTGHLQLVKVLEERSAQLNALLESTNGIVFSVLFPKGRLGNIDNVSQHLAQKVGFSQDELTRMQLKDLLVGTKKQTVAQCLSQAQKELSKQGKAVFTCPVRCKDESTFEAQLSLTVLDLPGEPAVLAVLRDLSAEQETWGRQSKEAQELRTVRSVLPGMYLKTDSRGKVLEVYSNLPYFPQTQATEVCLGKTPAQCWKKENSQKAVLALKEALSMNLTSRFDLEWSIDKQTHFFEVTITPIAGREETIWWLKDISQGHTHQEQVHELYQIISTPGLSMTQQVDKILEFGLKSFHADVGFVLRFAGEGRGLESHILYVSANDLGITRMSSFGVEECLYGVTDGNVLLWPDLSVASCHFCIHQSKGLKSLAAAPLLVGGKVMGALCFASKTSRKAFESGAEELMGLLARLLSLRIEVRQTGKMLSEASRALARTMEYVGQPAVMFDLDYQITFINQALLNYTGRRMENMMGRDFFEEVVRNEDLSKRAFQDARQNAEGNSFAVTLEIRTPKGSYEDHTFNVVVCQDNNGSVASYGLIETK